MRLRDASTRARTASLRHLRYCPLQTRMSEHSTIWGSKIFLIWVFTQTGNCLIEWGWLNSHGEAWVPVYSAALCPSIMYFPGVCCFKLLCWIVSTDSASVRTCVFLFACMHVCSLSASCWFVWHGLFYPAVPIQERDNSAILQDIAKARQNIQQSLVGVSTAPPSNNEKDISLLEHSEFVL